MVVSKSTILQELAKARLAHMRWTNRADHLISGLPVDKEFIPLVSTECGFGKWFYGPVGQELRLHDAFKDLMEQIELQHDDLHKVYAEIYRIYFVLPEQRSLLHKILTFNSKKVSDKDRQRARELFRSLKNTSDRLLALLDKLEILVKEVDLVPHFKRMELKRA